MLSLRFHGTRSCAAPSRRDFLRVGGLGAFGLTLPRLLQAKETRASGIGRATGGSFGKAKACILLFMDGGPPQQDTFDLKPDAPTEIRGEFKPIATTVPGLQISEYLPRIARYAHKFALLRSVHVGSDVHEVGTYAMLTGTRFKGNVIADRTRETPEDTPSIGSVISYLRGRDSAVPPYVWLPFIWKGFPIIAQGYGGFLGRRHDPFRILQDPNAPSFQIDALTLPGDVPLDRLSGRLSLLDALPRQADQVFQSSSAAQLDQHYRKAFDMLSSPQTRKAFDLASEDVRLRDHYGRHTFGQSALLARRLVEHGVPLVTVYYNDYRKKEPNFNNWDTHQKNYQVLKENLLPSSDRAFAALLEDMAERGLLDETLVVWMGDFGRTPKINGNGGRDHWGGCSCVLMAGAGIRSGMVLGSSDKIAAYPKDHPLTPDQVVATIYHCLGVDPRHELPDQFGRPMRICDGEPISALLS